MKIPSNCMDCQHHKELPDPDPFDWFCDDDMRVVCSLTRRKRNLITGACRPYNLRKESKRPSWCPLLRAASTKPRG